MNPKSLILPIFVVFFFILKRKSSARIMFNYIKRLTALAIGLLLGMFAVCFAYNSSGLDITPRTIAMLSSLITSAAFIAISLLPRSIHRGCKKSLDEFYIDVKCVSNTGKQCLIVMSCCLLALTCVTYSGRMSDISDRYPYAEPYYKGTWGSDEITLAVLKSLPNYYSESMYHATNTVAESVGGTARMTAKDIEPEYERVKIEIADMDKRTDLHATLMWLLLFFTSFCIIKLFVYYEYHRRLCKNRECV